MKQSSFVTPVTFSPSYVRRAELQSWCVSFTDGSIWTCNSTDEADHLKVDHHAIGFTGRKDMLAKEVASLCKMAQCSVHPEKLQDLLQQLPDS